MHVKRSLQAGIVKSSGLVLPVASRRSVVAGTPGDVPPLKPPPRKPPGYSKVSPPSTPFGYAWSECCTGRA